jgi:hypothetical protein
MGPLDRIGLLFLSKSLLVSFHFYDRRSILCSCLWAWRFLLELVKA